jgi:3',5'-cyclic AMP phosphodiesterase CpdA
VHLRGVDAARSAKLARVRILHVSDVHVEEGFGGVPAGDLINKRLVGLTNLWLRRRRMYRDAVSKLDALAGAATEWNVDLVIVTGDFTALGTAAELEAAERAIRPLLSRPLGAICLPGNHDVYLHDGSRLRFEARFADTLRDDLGRTDYPRVRLIGDDLAVVTFETARPNPEPWLSSGRVPTAQLEALRALGESGDIRARRVIFATHYAPFLEDGRPDHARHGLENTDALLAALAPFGEALFLHGHVHRRYHVRVPRSPLTFFCAGSATLNGREGFWLFDVDARGVRAVPGEFRDGAPALLDEQAVNLS